MSLVLSWRFVFLFLLPKKHHSTSPISRYGRDNFLIYIPFYSIQPSSLSKIRFFNVTDLG